MDRNLTRILVIHPGALGDTILALPVIAELRAQHETAVVHLIGHPALVTLLPGRSAVDVMSSIDGPQYLELLGDAMMFSGTAQFFRQFDLIVGWLADDEGKIRQRLIGLGISNVVVASPRLRQESPIHATDRFRATVAHPHLLFPSIQRRAAEYLWATEEDRKAAASWLADHSIDSGGAPVVAIHPGSGSRIKCWPPEYFAEVVSALIHDGAQVLVIEGPADEHAVDVLQQKLHMNLPCLRQASLSLVIGVLSSCSAFVGNDSGVTQLAAALGVSTVAIFGPTDPIIWASRGYNVLPVRGETGCRCPTHEMQLKCKDRICFSIEPAIVLHALRRQLPTAAPSLASDLPLC
jgi:ADP-heptose:LPS heptosyltransferase